MTDHLHPEANDDELLASALVDGAADLAGGRAEAGQGAVSPQLAATVQAFAAVREALKAPLAVDAAMRDNAVAVAMAEYDRLVDESAADAASTAGGAQVVDIASRRRWPLRVVAAAAAVAVVGVVGVATFGRSRDSDDVALDQPSAAERVAASTEDAATGGGDDAADGSQADEYATPTIGAINAPAEVVIAVNSPEQLLDLVEAKLAPLPDAPEADGLGGDVMMSGSAALHCLDEDQVFVVAIIYAGTPAIAVRDTVTGVTQAIDEQCNVLAEVAP